MTVAFMAVTQARRDPGAGRGQELADLAPRVHARTVAPPDRHRGVWRYLDQQGLSCDLSDLVGELSTRSELFGTLWAAHDVRTHDTGTKRIDHPLVGELNLSFEAMQLVADDGLTMFVYTSEPGSKSEQALNLLAGWTATPDEETADAARDGPTRVGRSSSSDR
jgi:hypothetical protein